MAKKNREKAETSSKVGKTQTQNHQSLTVKKEAVDPSLALLFASSVCIVWNSMRLFCILNVLLIFYIGWTGKSATQNPL
jgi:hypothetical protein